MRRIITDLEEAMNTLAGIEDGAIGDTFIRLIVEEEE